MSDSSSTLSVDKDTFKFALRRAKLDKLSLSWVIKILLMDYAKWYITIWTKQHNLTVNWFTQEEEKKILNAEKESDMKINVEGPFSTSEEIQNYLDKLK